MKPVHLSYCSHRSAHLLRQPCERLGLRAKISLYSVSIGPWQAPLALKTAEGNLHGFLYAAVNGVNSNTFDDRSVEPRTGSSMKNSKITEGSGICQYQWKNNSLSWFKIGNSWCYYACKPEVLWFWKRFLYGNRLNSADYFNLQLPECQNLYIMCWPVRS